MPDAAPPAFRSIVSDPRAWLRDPWVLIAGLAALLFVVWLSSGRTSTQNGRYVLVRDDIPCQSAVEGEDRRWCYLVLDTRSGKMEERVRKLRSRRGKR